jgi:hypothetical protein
MDTIYAEAYVSNYFKLNGVAVTIFTYSTKYAIGSRVYIIDSAKSKGKLESVVIKKYAINDDIYEIIYTDTLNRIWMEKELCSKIIAKEYALTYWDNLSESYLNS